MQPTVPGTQEDSPKLLTEAGRCGSVVRQEKVRCPRTTRLGIRRNPKMGRKLLYTWYSVLPQAGACNQSVFGRITHQIGNLAQLLLVGVLVASAD